MKVKVLPGKVCGTVNAIGSKSYAHRALISAAFFCEHSVEVSNVTPSEDVLATVDCLRALGVSIEQRKNGFVVTPAKEIAKSAVLNCRESGSTLRFFIPICAALGVSAKFCGSPKLFSRPLQPLFDVLESGGVTVRDFTVCGKLQPSVYTVRSDVSSQFVTGMLFALCMLNGKSTLKLAGNVVSKDYLNITTDVLEHFGTQIEQTNFGYEVFGNAPKSDITSYTVEGDWSNAAFMLACGALGGDVTVRGLNVNSRQGDRIILPLLQECGAAVSVLENGVRVQGGKLKAFCVNVENCPDLAPILSVLAANAEGVTQISGVERLRYKESDRLDGILKMLKHAGISVCVQNGVLSIVGGKPCGGSFFAANDHRMAMSQTVLALFAEGQSTVGGAECVAKSYPTFFEEISACGGKCIALER